MASVGKHIRRLRTTKGLTQEQQAEKLFVTRQTVSAWETGKAQPDLETLERIAEALGTEVTEVIYGTPQGANLGPLKRQWALIGGLLAAIICIIVIILIENGAYGTWRYGLAYQFTNADYAIAYEDVPGRWSVELDLEDLESNAGKVLYKDESGCRILVDSVDENEPGEYRVHFRSCGVYGREGGELVSGCQSVPVEKTSWTWEMAAAMTAAVEGEEYACSIAGFTGLCYKDGNMFSFHLNPRTEDGEQVSLEGLEKLTVTVTGLTCFSTRRVSYWGVY